MNSTAADLVRQAAHAAKLDPGPITDALLEILAIAVAEDLAAEATGLTKDPDRLALANSQACVLVDVATSIMGPDDPEVIAFAERDRDGET